MDARAIVVSALIGAAGLAAFSGVSAVLGQPAQPAGGQQRGGPDFGAMLAESLQSVDGCLGVESARTQSGKNVIVAWFKDVESARVWYHHPTHRRMIEMTGGDPDVKKPMRHVKDGTPVMVMATITPSARPEIEGVPMPISQISIELYTSLPGGASINGRFSPEGFPIEHHNE
ncbi:MAG: hypothetical protein KF838_08820 [Phycisphaeraceae bacterium]|nr:MAG: hypothetical protein KF838_08820 [Phycisphaeraceae bacterium]